MTRVNVVPVSELSRQHLVAEWREIHRIYGMVGAAIAKGKRPCEFKIPLQYTLGAGHMWFFGDKLRFIRWRQEELYAEMRRRGYKPGYVPPSALDVLAIVGYMELYGDYTPPPQALELNRARIMERS